MKKCLFSIFMIGCFVFSGCISYLVYDKNISDEDTFIIRVHNDFTVVSLNDKRVNWNRKIWGINLFKESNFNVVKIPAGEHKLILKYPYARDNIELIENFKAGEQYTLRPLVSNNTVSVMVTRY